MVQRILSHPFPFQVPARVRLVRGAIPAVDLWESAEALHLEAELPGYSESEVQVHLEGDELRILGDHAEPEGVERTEYLRERRSGRFERAFRLPVEVDVTKIEATLRDGVLTVRLPKAQSVKPRTIEVKRA